MSASQRAPSSDVTCIPNAAVREWVKKCVEMCQPAGIRLIDGSASEKADLLAQAAHENVLIRLNQNKLPGCYLHRSNPNDVARTEHLTFICTPHEHTVGPTNNWMSDVDGYAKLTTLFTGCMRGKTMYVIPFVMGPLGSPLAKVGIQLTDSIYVAINMGIMTRMGQCAWEQLGSSADFTRCLHSVGECDPNRRFICHFPLDNTIWSYGSGYGGNALLGKKCLALRLASFQAEQEEWMAEHMLLLCVTDPQGEKTYVAAAFPSACGKTNFAMLVPPPKYRDAGWKVTTLGDDIVWMSVQPDGRLWAVNPEFGYFGVLPGTSELTNASAMASMARDTIYTNAAMLPDGDVWWEGKTAEPPEVCIDWMGQPWTKGCGRPAAHPNSRFTAPMMNNPVLDTKANDPAGVPVSAIIFGGRRSTTVPLVAQAFDWIHGVYLGAFMGSETTSAATGAVGVIRRDPMAMLPFCGYNLNNYLAHWLRMRKKLTDAPRVFMVNWFRKSAEGKILWPGYGDNMRVLQWILDRCRGRAGARETPLGWMPRPGDIDLEGMSFSKEQFDAVQKIDKDEIGKEVVSQQEFFLKLGADVPKELMLQRELLVSRL